MNYNEISIATRRWWTLKGEKMRERVSIAQLAFEELMGRKLADKIPGHLLLSWGTIGGYKGFFDFVMWFSSFLSNELWNEIRILPNCVFSSEIGGEYAGRYAVIRSEE